MNDIFLDTETTGLSFSHNHKIVEIACIETKDLVPINKIFHKLINPERDVPDEAFKIHGFSTDFLKDKPTFKQVADEFVEFIKDKKLIIHNAKFDVMWLIQMGFEIPWTIYHPSYLSFQVSTLVVVF